MKAIVSHNRMHMCLVIVALLSFLVWILRSQMEFGQIPLSPHAVAGHPSEIKFEKSELALHRDGLDGRSGIGHLMPRNVSHSDQVKAIAEAAGRNFESSAFAHQKEAQRFGEVKDSQFPLRDLAEEAYYMFLAEKLSLAAVMARKGYHEIIPVRDARPVTPFGFEECWTGIFDHPSLGQVEALVRVPLSDIKVSAARKSFLDLSDAADEEYVGIFNNMPWNIRRDRWQDHLQAMQEISDASKSRGLSDEQREAWRSALGAKILDLKRYRMEDPGYWLRVRR